MFGIRYFGNRYFGGRYFGHTGSGVRGNASITFALTGNVSVGLANITSANAAES